LCVNFASRRQVVGLRGALVISDFPPSLDDRRDALPSRPRAQRVHRGQDESPAWGQDLDRLVDGATNLLRAAPLQGDGRVHAAVQGGTGRLGRAPREQSVR